MKCSVEFSAWARRG